MLPATSTCWHSTARGPRSVGVSQLVIPGWPLPVRGPRPGTTHTLLRSKVNFAFEKSSRKLLLDSLYYYSYIKLLLYEDQPRLFSTLCTHWKLRAKCGCAWVTRMWKLIWPLISSLIVFPIDSNSVLTCQIVRHGLVATSLETRTVTPPQTVVHELCCANRC